MAGPGEQPVVFGGIDENRRGGEDAGPEIGDPARGSASALASRTDVDNAAPEQIRRGTREAGVVGSRQRVGTREPLFQARRDRLGDDSRLHAGHIAEEHAGRQARRKGPDQIERRPRWRRQHHKLGLIGRLFGSRGQRTDGARTLGGLSFPPVGGVAHHARHTIPTSSPRQGAADGAQADHGDGLECSRWDSESLAGKELGRNRTPGTPQSQPRTWSPVSREARDHDPPPAAGYQHRGRAVPSRKQVCGHRLDGAPERFCARRSNGPSIAPGMAWFPFNTPEHTDGRADHCRRSSADLPDTDWQAGALRGGAGRRAQAGGRAARAVGG